MPDITLDTTGTLFCRGFVFHDVGTTSGCITAATGGLYTVSTSYTITSDCTYMVDRYATDHATWMFAAGAGTQLDPVDQWTIDEAARKVEYDNRLAAHRAVNLLFALLDEVQQSTLLEHGYFDMAGADGHRYRLLYHRHGNVMRLGPDDAVLASWCGHYGEDLPVADTLIAQKLVLEFDPGAYLCGANPVSVHHRSHSQPYANYKEKLDEALAGPPDDFVPTACPEPPRVEQPNEVVPV